MGIFRPITPWLQPGNPLARGLVGAWEFTEGSGLVAYDSSPLQNHSTFAGTIPTWKGGASGSSLSFGGAGNANGRFVYNFGSISLLARLNNGSGTGFKRLFTLDPSGSQPWSGLLTGQLLAQLTNNNTEYSNTSSGSIPATVSTHVAIVKDLVNSKVYFYINGKLDTNSYTSSVDPSAATVHFLGGLSSSQFYDGTMDYLHIYDRAVAADEVAMDCARVGA